MVILSLLLLVVQPSAPTGAEAGSLSETKSAQEEDVPRRVFEKLTTSFEAKNQAFWSEYQKLESHEAQEKALAEQPDATPVARKVLDLAKLHPGTDVGLDCVAWTLTYGGQSLEGECLAFAAKHYAQSPKAGTLFGLLGHARAPEALTFLEAVYAHVDKNGLEGKAEYYLAQHFIERLAASHPLEFMNANEIEDLSREIGKGAVESLRSLDPKATSARTVELLQAVIADHPRLRGPMGKLSELATRDLFELEHLSPGCAAPATSGEDLAGEPISLHDYRGKIVFLDFWGHW